MGNSYLINGILVLFLVVVFWGIWGNKKTIERRLEENIIHDVVIKKIIPAPASTSHSRVMLEIEDGTLTYMLFVAVVEGTNIPILIRVDIIYDDYSLVRVAKIENNKGD